MQVDERAVMAAGNNADLYEAVFATQGLNYARLPFAFVGRDAPPPYYSNLTALLPDAVDSIVLQVRALAEQFNGAVGLKDSFCRLDLAANGFDVLFEASWIWRAPGTSTPAADWQRVDNEADLLLWEEAWKQCGSATGYRMFRAGMLQRPDMVFLGRKTDGAFEAGCIANRSADCLGLSNIFSRSPSAASFAEAAAAAAWVDRHKPLVGYEAGENLHHAHMAGFETVGKLRVLVTEDASF